MVHGKASADYLPLLEPVCINRMHHTLHTWRAGKGKSERHSLGGGERASRGRSAFVLEMESHCTPLCAPIGRPVIRSKAAIISEHCAAAVGRRRLQNGSSDSAEA